MKRAGMSTAIILGIAGLGGLASGAQNQPPKMPRNAQTGMMTAQVPAPPEELTITFGDKSATWTADQLAGLPHLTVTVHNAHSNADETYSGVPLIALLTPLGVSEKPRGKDLRLSVMAEGSDLYEVVYSIAEVTPDVSNATVIVADRENGKALASDGPLKLIATNDKRPARWVRSLVAIKVFAAE